MKDYYSILGVERSANADDIKKAYRALAMKHHPDRGGDVTKFQEIQEAYATLGDADKRTRYDSPHATFGGFGNNGNFDFNAIFEMFGSDLKGSMRRPPPRIILWISLVDVFTGGPRTVSLQVGHSVSSVEINVPQGIHDDDTIRYPGIAPGGQDLIVNFRIRPDPVWIRDNKNLIIEQTIDIWDLILGTELTVSDVMGNQLVMTIPPETQPGTVLRARGKGLPARKLPNSRGAGDSPGDLMIKLMARINGPIDPAIIEAIRKSRGV